MSRLQPRPKAVPTSNTSSQTASATSADASAPVVKIAACKTDSPRTTSRPSPSDPVSDRSTLLLIRRTLCSHLGDKGRGTPAPIDEILPPLTSSNEVDLQLYAFIAIIIREFVHTWYSKITPDPVFVEEVVKIIAHCTRALEQRLRNVDVESLLFDELPDLLDVHLQAYRTAHNPANPAPLESKPREIYHSLWPMPALSPVPDEPGGPLTQQQINKEALYRQILVQGVLAVLLPTEDLENDCLTTLVGQIFSEMILGNGIGGKGSEPWLIWEGITKIAEVMQAQLPRSKANVRLARSNSGSIDAFPIPDAMSTRKNNWGVEWSLQKTFWLVLQYLFVAFTAIRFLVLTLATSSSLPSRIATSKTPNLGILRDQMSLPDPDPTPADDDKFSPSKTPIIKMKIWSAAAHLLDFDFRMPWLAATLSMLQWGALMGPGQLGTTDGRIDK
ncbi:PXA domain-containing protein [Amylocarpus encephaloides]|uniref:PXA domain-containing protein n=1 Tax=Amylocarpus encephaloides TaxID=45428 RepID=A0A9P7YT94_9HELO|nr:PXA domain-containing protein [Amylocarpus encephaloides]